MIFFAFIMSPRIQPQPSKPDISWFIRYCILSMFFWRVNWEAAVDTLDPGCLHLLNLQLDVPSLSLLWPLYDTFRGTNLTLCARWGGLTGLITGSALWTNTAAHTPDLHSLSQSSIELSLDRVWKIRVWEMWCVRGMFTSLTHADLSYFFLLCKKIILLCCFYLGGGVTFISVNLRFKPPVNSLCIPLH